jgi:hypothetical protein
VYFVLSVVVISLYGKENIWTTKMGEFLWDVNRSYLAVAIYFHILRPSIVVCYLSSIHSLAPSQINHLDLAYSYDGCSGVICQAC